MALGRQVNVVSYPSSEARIAAAIRRMEKKQQPGYHNLTGMGLTSEDLDEIIKAGDLDAAIVLQIDAPVSSLRRLGSLKVFYLTGRHKLDVSSGYLPDDLEVFCAPHTTLTNAAGLEKMAADAARTVQVARLPRFSTLGVGQPKFRVNNPDRAVQRVVR